MPIYKMSGRKDGRQKYRVRINFTGPDGKARQIERVAYGAEEAKQLEYQLLNGVKNKVLSPKAMSVNDLFDEYISVKRFEVKESTVFKSVRNLQNHILPTMGKVRIDKLTTSVLQKWKTGIEEKGLELKTKKNIYAEFRAMLSYAVKMEYIPINPLTKIGNFKDPYHTSKDIVYYTPEEFKKYISAARSEAESKGFNEWNYYVFFNIAFYTGMRKGEIHALKWSDIDGDIIHVKRSINQKLPGEDRETPPKNIKSIRSLQLPKPLIDILKEHRQRYSELDGFNNDWRICGGQCCLRDSTVSAKNIHYADLAGVKQISIHGFRHSHASLLANEAINIQEISRRLGHAKIEMTWNTYSHLYPREEERAVEILNKIL